MNRWNKQERRLSASLSRYSIGCHGVPDVVLKDSQSSPMLSALVMTKLLCSSARIVLRRSGFVRYWSEEVEEKEEAEQVLEEGEEEKKKKKLTRVAALICCSVQ